MSQADERSGYVLQIFAFYKTLCGTVTVMDRCVAYYLLRGVENVDLKLILLGVFWASCVEHGPYLIWIVINSEFNE